MGFEAEGKFRKALQNGRVMAAMGGVLLLTGILTPGGALESLVGRPAGSLAWGPALFRALLAFHGLVLVAFASTAPASPQATLLPNLSRRTWGALLALAVVALALRLFRLDSCLWLDEVLTMVDFARAPLGHVLSSFPNQNQHMLYSLLANSAIGVFGEHAWALRLPSVVFGVASLWALFLLGRKVIGETGALAACALMTVSYHHIWFSQNARGYMGLLLFSTLATWLWLEASERDEWRVWILYSVTGFLGMWIHSTMLFVLGSHALLQACFAIWKGDWRNGANRKALVAWLLCATFTAQAQGLALPEFFRTAVHEVSMPSEWTNPFWVVAESVRSLRLGFASFAVLISGAAMVAFGWFDVLRRDGRAALAMVLPPLLGGGSMLVLAHNLWPRFFFFSMGFALLIVIHGALAFPPFLARLVRAPESGSRLARYAGVAAVALVIVASASTVPRCYALPKQDYTGARDFVESAGTPADSVVVVGLAGHVYGKYYAPRWFVAQTAQELESFESAHPRAALVYTLPIELKAFHPELWQAVASDFETVKVFPGTLGGGEVFVCRPKARPSDASAPARTISSLMNGKVNAQ